MCGRYVLTTSPAALRRLFELPQTEPLPNLPARYNIAPTETVPIVRRAGDGTRRLSLMRWGLIPFWAKDASIGARLINARAETVAGRPAFRAAFRERRCLVPADAFYEWRKTARGKQPFCYRMTDERPFAFAGLWERWQGPEGETLSCTIITTDANDTVRPVHARMPVILAPADYERWLDVSAGGGEMLLRPYAGTDLKGYPVSPRVNSPRNDDPACIEPVALDSGENGPSGGRATGHET